MAMREAPTEASRLVRFYLGIESDDRGRRIDDILMFADYDLEHTHDYIQWLFPLTTASAFNLGAPVLTPEDIATFRSDERIRKNMKTAFLRMLAFYGFQLFDADGKPLVKQTQEWADRSRGWLDPYNHIHLRITRILKSLGIADMQPLAVAFYDALRAVYEHGPAGSISARTFDFWTKAVEHPF